MTGQPPVSSEAVISILRIRLSEEIYQRAMLEAAYNQATQQVKTLTEQLAGTEHQLTETQAEPPGNQTHQFEPGENPLRCQHCGYLKDAARHTPASPKKSNQKNNQKLTHPQTSPKPPQTPLTSQNTNLQIWSHMINSRRDPKDKTGKPQHKPPTHKPNKIF